jgi:hypothetical protein
MNLSKLNIEFVEHMGYYIPKSAVEGFDPETYFDGPTKLDENGLCDNEICQKQGFCRLKNIQENIETEGSDIV